MLLSHSGGLGDFLDRKTPAMMSKGVKRAEEFLPLFEKDAPLFEPGSDREYSNAGLVLAGAIVEKVSGLSYPEYLKRNIFVPIGMTSSDPNNIPHRDPRMVVPYTHTSDRPEWTEAERDIGSPAGGAISTAEDLTRFAEGFRNGKLISNETFEAIIQKRDHPTGPRYYGYAIAIETIEGRKVIGHGGGFPGVSTGLSMVLDTPYTLIVLSNQDPPAAERVSGYVLSLIAAMPRS